MLLRGPAHVQVHCQSLPAAPSAHYLRRRRCCCVPACCWLPAAVGLAAVIAQAWQRRPDLPVATQPCAQSRPVCGPKRTGRWRRAAAGVANNTRQPLHCESFAFIVLGQRCLLSAGLRQARVHWPRNNGMPNFTWLAADGLRGRHRAQP